MGERIPASVTIGGPVRRSSVRTIAEACEAEAVGINNYCGDHGPSEYEAAILAAAEQGKTLMFGNAEANYGTFDWLDPALFDEGVEHDFRSDARYEYDGEVRVARLADDDDPTTLVAESFAGDQSGNALFRLDEVAEALDWVDETLEAGGIGAAIQAVRDRLLVGFATRPLRPLTLVDG